MTLENISVEKIEDYHGNRADKTFILERESDVQRLRTHYLKHKRSDWTWVDSNTGKANYVIIKENQ